MYNAHGIFLHEFRVVDVEEDGVLDVVGIVEYKLEELGASHGGTERVLGRDRLVEHAQDSLLLRLLAVQLDGAQIARSLLLLLSERLNVNTQLVSSFNGNRS